jgi:hypothetical protein
MRLARVLSDGVALLLYVFLQFGIEFLRRRVARNKLWVAANDYSGLFGGRCKHIKAATSLDASQKACTIRLNFFLGRNVWPQQRRGVSPARRPDDAHFSGKRTLGTLVFQRSAARLQGGVFAAKLKK